MKKNELWTDKLKQRLSEHTPPLPPDGWERLERELAPTPVMKTRPLRQWVRMAAAVAALVALSTAAYLYWVPDGATELAQTALPGTSPDLLPSHPLPDSSTAAPHTLPVVTARPAHTGEKLIAQARTEEEKAIPPDTPADEGEQTAISSGTPTGVKKDSDKEKDTDKEKAIGTTQKRTRPARPSSKDKYQLPAEKTPKRGGGWSMGISAAGVIASSDGTIERGNGYPSRMNIASSADALVEVPKGEQVVFNDGVPYLLAGNQITDIKHRQPISVGVSVRKALPRGFSVETGLTYTLLSSDVTLSGSERAVSQKLHYIGLPVRANWNFLEKRLVTLYASGGGMVEKCVYGKLGSDKLTVKPLQFSVMGGVGAQINATKRVGFYVEPGVAYYFDNGSAVRTIRKDTPFNFNLQAGLRLTY
ncbi:MAG: PorT family protein [Mediterranea sp.]|jgi:hypothetical protein|nr:PorT family protein [Mediterranea sp.]